MADELLSTISKDVIIERVRKLLKNSGKGFAFIGDRHRLRAGEGVLKVDLLFYNTKLHAYVAVAVGKSERGCVDRMGTCIGVLDDSERSDGDRSSIGLVFLKGASGWSVQCISCAMRKSDSFVYHVGKKPEIAALVPGTQDIERVARSC